MNLDTWRFPQLAGLTLGNRGLVLADGQLTPEGYGALSALVSAVICLVFYKGSRYVTPVFFPSYKTLSREEQRNWDTRYSSNIHAVICVYFAYTLLVASDFFWKDSKVPMILRTNPSSYVALGCSFGYFVVDIFSCIKYNMGGVEMVLHHFGSLLSVTTALVTGDGHLHTMWMLVTEFTTPLINNRWWLDKMEMKTSKLYIINGLAILFSWIFARLAVFPPFFWVVWKYRDQIPLITDLSKFLLLVVPIILTVLNIYWFTKIVKGAIKVLFGPRDKQD